MKYILLVLFTISITQVFSQTEDFASLLKKGKAEFSKEFEEQDYATAVSYLEKAVKLRPRDAEARYFLGYAYSRLNSKDGASMVNTSLPLTLKSSEQFEEVIKIDPKYKGEIVILDPYSKIGSDWGSLAMSYWHNAKQDSAVWAFKEGKKRGGFSDFILTTNRNTLDVCNKNAILISSGDAFTIPLWYLQIVEKYRTDVSVIDISLLSSIWYPRFLADNNVVDFDLPDQSLDTLQYCEWADTTITISGFSWIVKPSYEDGYLLRGNRLLLSLLKQNSFKRDVYFTIAFQDDQRLNLKDYLRHQVFVDYLNYGNNVVFNDPEYSATLTKALRSLELVNKNSPDELRLVNNVRYSAFVLMDNYLEDENNGKAKSLLKLMDKHLHPKKYPLDNESWKAFDSYMRSSL